MSVFNRAAKGKVIAISILATNLKRNLIMFVHASLRQLQPCNSYAMQWVEEV